MLKAGTVVAAVLLISTGCASARPARPAQTPVSWRAVATAADAQRLHDWRDAFVKGLAEARAAGKSADLAREGVLLAPDAALAGPLPPPGTYRCRTIKLGSGGGSGLGFIAYSPFDCRIADEGEVSSFAKLTGSQRPVGLIFRGDDRRQVFLGTMMLGDEIRALEYGRDPDRDMAGAVERIGPRRWRLLLPYPRFESTFDVVELIPAN